MPARALALASWWWPKRPARIPRARAAGLLAGAGVALFGISALVLEAGTLGWDESLFHFLNDVPPAVASVLTPLSHLFLPVGIVVVIALAAVYVVARNRSIMPVAAGLVAAVPTWALAALAKARIGRLRPYEVLSGVVLRQPPAHGMSFPSSHTAITVAVVIALVPFLPRALAGVAIAYAVLVGWSRVYLGVHYPLDILGGAGIGIAMGGVVLLALVVLFQHHAGRTANDRDAAAQAPGTPSR